MAFVCSLCKNLIELSSEGEFYRSECCIQLFCHDCYHNKINAPLAPFSKNGCYLRPVKIKCVFCNEEDPVFIVRKLILTAKFCFGCHLYREILLPEICRYCSYTTEVCLDCKNKGTNCISCKL